MRINLNGRKVQKILIDGKLLLKLFDIKLEELTFNSIEYCRELNSLNSTLNDFKGKTNK